ncbi:expressed unknown protein [Seminavis robusta]|uniref:Uncharacterized protein n=1 Tax=Seminavis robusta TaxID=568900 RepID=A0A9N8HBT5_9STRA|nr:expressed unknown protein [Seminavis robusta]|eukprot:Sro195_g083130.1 n/a (741) ;mRNA; f:28802-31024
MMPLQNHHRAVLAVLTVAVWCLLLLPPPAHAQTDEHGLLQTYSFNWGTFAIFASYVPLISICLGNYRSAVEAHTYWNATEDQILLARRCIWTAALEAIGVFLMLIIISAITIALLTNPLDERMDYIIEGVSRLTSSVIQFQLSIRVAIWMGVYQNPFSSAKQMIEVDKVGTTVVELKHRVRWSVSKRILRSFFFLCFLFQGANAAELPLAILAGLAFGFFVDWGIYKARRFESRCRQSAFNISFLVGLTFWSLVQLANGVLFIAAVWQDTNDVEESTWDIWAFFIGVVLFPAIHITIYCLTRRKGDDDDEEEEEINQVVGGESVTSSAKTTVSKPRPRMAASMFFSDRNVIKKKLEESKDVHVAAAMAEIEEEEEGNEEEGEKGGADVEKDGQEGDKEGGEKEGQADQVQGEDGAHQEGQEMGIEAGVQKEEEDGEHEIQPTELESGMETNETEAQQQSTPESPQKDGDNDEMPPTLWELMMDWQWCGCARGDDMSAMEKTTNVIVWILYLAICALCLFFVVINIGSTQQQEAVRVKLPFVYGALYEFMDEGPVCAYNNKGANSTITTFPDKDAAHAAGFLILHCGACSNCSTWGNLEIQYTTRECLALEGRKCAQGSLFGGGYDALVDCIESDSIGFQGQCAVCWADDIKCTISHCWAIGVQSFFINTLANFKVGEDTITSATCEEAHCEAGNPGDFVACSGANRRRMNITSSIARPGAQQCSIVDVDYPKLFPKDKCM